MEVSKIHILNGFLRLRSISKKKNNPITLSCLPHSCFYGEKFLGSPFYVYIFVVCSFQC